MFEHHYVSSLFSLPCVYDFKRSFMFGNCRDAYSIHKVYFYFIPYQSIQKHHRTLESRSWTALSDLILNHIHAGLEYSPRGCTEMLTYVLICNELLVIFAIFPTSNSFYVLYYIIIIIIDNIQLSLENAITRMKPTDTKFVV